MRLYLQLNFPSINLDTNSNIDNMSEQIDEDKCSPTELAEIIRQKFVEVSAFINSLYYRT